MELKEVLAQGPVFAFNCDDFVIFRAVVEAVRETGRPVIVQISPGEMDFWGLERFVNLVKNENLPLFLNFDHCRDFSLAQRIIDLDFKMIHFDGSELNWEENIDLTRKVVDLARKKGILVEGEPEREKTDPQKAAQFVQETGVNLIAVFVGNKHGIDPENSERLDFKRLEEIKASVGEKHLTLHGGSGVEQADLKQAVRQKLVAKVNINSQLRLVYRRALEGELEDYQGLKIYQLLKPVASRLKEEVKKLIGFAYG